jgi:adenosylcobyric acid synthase
MGLFHDGVAILEEKTGRRCLGVFPYAETIELDSEDSLKLDERRAVRSNPEDGDHPRIAIIRLPHISNFTDFRLMPAARYLTVPAAEQFDFIFLPGTKNTIDDLQWLRSNGFESWLIGQHRDGATIVGVCGGYQMLGDEILDPDGVECGVPAARGLAMIPGTTRLMPQKTTRKVKAYTRSGIPFEAYEIHAGVTESNHSVPPFAVLDDGARDGVHMDRIVGTYLHGVFENRLVLEELLGRSLVEHSTPSKEIQYDLMADWFSAHVDHEIFNAEYM